MSSENKSTSKRRHTIGFLIDWIGGRYQSELWPALAQLAAERDVNLVIFSGGTLGEAMGMPDDRVVLYDLVSPECVDGLVIASGSISNYISKAVFEQFVAKFDGLPMVSIAQDLPGISSVVADNCCGIQEMVSHLIEVHGCKRIAFVRGPEENDEAIARFYAYQESLEAHGIPYDPELVAPGVFLFESGIEAVQLWIDERKVSFDAVVAADDDTALGVINELQRRGITVPGDVAVTGFDDVEEAGYSFPSLTTVRQPFRMQAHKAGELLLDLLDGKPAPETIRLSTETVIRQSCGCVTETIQEAGYIPVPDAAMGKYPLEDRVGYVQIELEQALNANLEQAASDEDYKTWARKLLISFEAELAGAGIPKFHETLRECVQKAQGLRHLSRWQNVISRFRQSLYTHLPEQASMPKSESMLGQARVLVADYVETFKASELLRSQQRTILVDTAGQSMLTALEMEPLLQLIVEAFLLLDIPSSYISLYDPASPDREWANILLAYQEHTVKQVLERDRRFRSRQLMPGSLLPGDERFVWEIEALYFQGEQLGFAIFEMGPEEGVLYAALRRQLSSALKGALLLQERRQAEAALKAAFKELESFSYSVSHDLRAPLRAIMGFSTLLQSDFSPNMNTEQQYLLEKISAAAADMNAKINSLLTFSRMSRSDLVRTSLDLSALAEDVIQALRASSGARSVIVDVTPGMTASADVTLMRNVMENLLGNAWKYTSKNPQARITFGVVPQDGKTVYFVRDNGVGFDMKYADKLFGTFQRLHPVEEFEGQGIGLATVKRIIRRHGGEIWFDAAVGKGATFYFTLG